MKGLTRNFNIKTCSFQSRYSFLKILPCYTTNLLTDETDKISVALNTSGATRAIALDILNVFDKIEHSIGLPQKIRFYCVYCKMFFHIESFFSSTRI